MTSVEKHLLSPVVQGDPEGNLVLEATLQNAATEDGNGAAAVVSGHGVAAFQVTGTFVATVTFQATIDGSTWVSLQAYNVATGAVGATTTAPGVFVAAVAGLAQVRAVVSGYVSGSVTVILQAVPGASLSLADVDIVGAEEVDVTDRAARDLGKVDVADVDGFASVAGQKAMAASFPVVLASDQSAVPVSSDGTTIAQTPTVTAGVYVAGDAVGGLLTFANAARVSGGGGVLMSVVIVDDAGQDAELELWLFNQTFAAMVDNAPWAPTEADLENLIAIVSTADSAQGWRAAGTPSVIDIEVSKRCDLVGTSLFGQLATRGTPTFAATDDVTVKVGLLQD